jgi:hypothetical protein
MWESLRAKALKTLVAGVIILITGFTERTNEVYKLTLVNRVIQTGLSVADPRVLRTFTEAAGATLPLPPVTHQQGTTHAPGFYIPTLICTAGTAGSEVFTFFITRQLFMEFTLQPDGTVTLTDVLKGLNRESIFHRREFVLELLSTSTFENIFIVEKDNTLTAITALQLVALAPYIIKYLLGRKKCKVDQLGAAAEEPAAEEPSNKRKRVYSDEESEGEDGSEGEGGVGGSVNSGGTPPVQVVA